MGRRRLSARGEGVARSGAPAPADRAPGGGAAPQPSAPSDAPAPAPIVGRLAPSPTGELHVGHARSFLLAWWHARSRGGRIVLRIEDLDAGRVRPGMLDACLRDLEWLGLDWDGPPLVQSADPAPIAAALDDLVRRGLVYPCTCTRREIQEAWSAPHGRSGETRYPGTCRDRFATLHDAEASTGRPVGLRLRVPPGPITLTDGIAGPFTHDVSAEVGDFLVARRDGFFAYQLAVVVDDARQGVTDVLRGADLLPSTPRQHLLQQALGLPTPRWFHVPLVLDPTGQRLAKRDASTTLASLRATGLDPRTLVAWAARTSGLPSPRRPTPHDLLPHFDLALLPRTPPTWPPSPGAP